MFDNLKNGIAAGAFSVATLAAATTAAADTPDIASLTGQVVKYGFSAEHKVTDRKYVGEPSALPSDSYGKDLWENGCIKGALGKTLARSNRLFAPMGSGLPYNEYRIEVTDAKTGKVLNEQAAPCQPFDFK